jgi:serine/threonine protein kinase
LSSRSIFDSVNGMAPTDHLAAGSVFAGRFRIVDLLGRGEMGATYAADPLPAGRRSALKVMDAALAKTPAWRERFATDAKRTSIVASPHVLQTLDAGIDSASGRPWFTTELLRGENLAKRVSRVGRLPLSEVRLLVIALGDALGEAHAQKLVHHDLTPENVHLAPGSPFNVRLRELTISSLISDACAAEGDLIGTAIWMPPEQFELGRPLSPAANVWSLGLLAFYAATGSTYWARASGEAAPSKELLREILSDPLVPASERARALGCAGVLPRRFDKWFARCLMRDPRGRFADAHAAYSAFDRVDRPDSVVPPAIVPSAVVPSVVAPSAIAPSVVAPPVVAPPVVAPQVIAPPVMAPPVVAPPVVARPPVAPSAMSPTPPAAATSVPAALPPRTAKQRGSRLRVLAFAAIGVAFGIWLWNDGSVRRAAPAAATLPAASTPAAPSASIAPPPSASTPYVSRAAASAVDAGESSAVGDAADDLGGFDLGSALRALNRVYYGDCHVPSAGVMSIAFSSSGRVKKVALVQGDYDEQTTGCLLARFGAATMAPFRGASQTVTANLVATP